ncbi:MAG: AAA family ATPase [Oscillospiraceae bacterium]|nr:AAA family ATPase [Oscillospiraceae bacterium]
MGKNILFTSGKGGTGKTASAAAVASCLASLGHRTICLDCDVGLKNLDLALGVSDRSVMDFTDVLSGQVSLSDAAVAHPEIENLFFLSAPSTAMVEDIDPKAMKALGDDLREQFDYCIIDGPAGIGKNFRLAAEPADSAIVVANGDAACLRDGQRAVMELRQLGLEDVRLLVNRVKGFFFKCTSSTIDDVIDNVGARLIGVIPEDKDVLLSGGLEKPLCLYNKDSRALAQFMAVARRITGEDVPLGKIRA